MKEDMIEAWHMIAFSEGQAMLKIHREALQALLTEVKAQQLQSHAYMLYLLDRNGLWSEEGTYTFPDGMTIYRSDYGDPTDV